MQNDGSLLATGAAQAADETTAGNASHEDRIHALETALAELKGDRSIGAAIGGKFSLKFPARAQGPEGSAYILVRESGGYAKFIDAPDIEDSDWSDEDDVTLHGSDHHEDAGVHGSELHTDDGIHGSELHTDSGVHGSELHTASGVHGAELHTNISRTFYLNASAFAAIAGTPDLAGRGDDSAFFDFPGWALDATTAEFVGTSFFMPADWDGGTVSIKQYLSVPDSNAGNIQMFMILRGIAEGDSIDTSQSTSGEVVAAPAATDRLFAYTESAVTIAGSPSGNPIRMVVYRDPADVDDTYASDVWFLGTLITYTATQ